MRKKANDKGELMIEAMIVMIVTLMVLFMIFSLGFWFYQKSMLTTLASEMADDIAHNYK